MDQEIHLKPDFPLPDAQAGRPQQSEVQPTENALPRPSKAGRVPTRRGMTAAEGFAVIVSACLDHYRSNEPLVVETRNAEALHQLRVAIRRLRSALSLFRPLLRDGESRHIGEELAWFAGELGLARDFDVCLQRELRGDERRALEDSRERAYDSVIETIRSERFRQLILELTSWAAAGEWRRVAKSKRRLGPFTNRRIDRLWARVSTARGLRRMSVEDRHRFRIEVKKLRYALEFVAALHRRRPKPRRKFAKAIERLQDEMGLLNDIRLGRSLTSPELWRLDPSTFEMDEDAHVREAKAALQRMRAVGAYWRD